MNLARTELLLQKLDEISIFALVCIPYIDIPQTPMRIPEYCAWPKHASPGTSWLLLGTASILESLFCKGSM